MIFVGQRTESWRVRRNEVASSTYAGNIKNQQTIQKHQQ